MNKNSRFKGKITLHAAGEVSDTPLALSDVLNAGAEDEMFDDYPQAATDAAQKALDWLRENDNPNGCLTAVGFARANQLAKREPISYNIVKRMANFKRQEQNKDTPYDEGCGGIAWDAWGGDKGIEWAIKTVERVEAAIEKEEREAAENSRDAKTAFTGTGAREFLDYRSALRPQEAPENIAIDPEQILLVPFRLVSATIVGANSYKATYFPPEILMASMPLLLNKPVYRDHMMYPDGWLGLVQSLEWGRAYTQNGLSIPAGINAMLAIDTASEHNANLARGIVMGAVRSNSVTVEFLWKPSHEFQHAYQFWDALGTEVDGRIVTRVVTEILDYHETSIVGLGADPYAKKIGPNGELIDVDLANSVPDMVPPTGFSSETEREEYRQAAKSTSFSIVNKDSFFNHNNKTKGKMANKEKREFATGFGAKLSGYMDNLTATQNLTRGEVKQRLADAVGVSVRTVELYLSGDNACPKARYVEEWAKILNVETGELADAAMQDGCTFTEAELVVLKGGTKKENDGHEEGEAEEEKEEMKETTENGGEKKDDEEMAKGKDKEEEEEEEDMKKDTKDMTAAFNELLAEFKALRLEVEAKKVETPEVIEATVEVKGSDAEEKETVEASAATEEPEAETGVDNFGAEGYRELIASYKKQLEEAEAEMRAMKTAYKKTRGTDAERIATLSADLLDRDAVIAKLREEKASYALAEGEAEELRVELKQMNKAYTEANASLEAYKANERFTEIGREYFEKMREEAKRYYRASFGQKSKDAVVRLFDSVQTIDELNGLVEQYGKTVADQFEVRCTKCNSNTGIEFGSVITTVDKDAITRSTTVMTENDIRDQMSWASED